MASSGIRIAGFGGQGVILAGIVIGKAAAIHDGKFATLTQSFGPEARGSACSAQLIVSDEPILYPYLTQPDILVVMSQEANRLFGSDLKPGGLLLYEQDLIHLDKTTQGMRHYGIPATRFAEDLGRRLVLNIVMVGFVTALTGLATPPAVRKAIADSVPKGTENLNLAAFEKGLEFGQGLVSAPTQRNPTVFTTKNHTMLLS
ncbi:MAG TPA: 2-oxoacid:acceptor oxidoreductase family protein [Terriglobia bacterium]|nr:2-oxoacid:acceptor oxidoreductase family protein [Terriglobia bacterium]